MNVIAAHLEKLKDYLFILLVTGIYTLVANTFGYNGDIAQGSVGILIIVAHGERSLFQNVTAW